ncbi:hypothetical protein HYPSUDRAFT_426346 [Hypholoma sublateritium FD-334 SS-4]|uniref:Uncharacterized protein n=1 Tax=Hypholoma sublateritium (strain FD-334 SS-4) TaxID=945553 RepID=A0A0D2Q1G9_HYPSF|nr:hypothetical protein HYPSUDRAFT_426346 [Hypholoma sublateritium FD-334 SS-4]
MRCRAQGTSGCTAGKGIANSDHKATVVVRAKEQTQTRAVYISKPTSTAAGPTHKRPHKPGRTLPTRVIGSPHTTAHTHTSQESVGRPAAPAAAIWASSRHMACRLQPSLHTKSVATLSAVWNPTKSRDKALVLCLYPVKSAEPRALNALSMGRVHVSISSAPLSSSAGKLFQVPWNVVMRFGRTEPAKDSRHNASKQVVRSENPWNADEYRRGLRGSLADAIRKLQTTTQSTIFSH